MRCAAGLAAILWIAALAAARADDGVKAVEIVIPVEVQNDWNFSSESADNRHYQLYSKIEPEVTVHLWRGLSFHAHSVLEAVTDPNPGQDRFFKDHGLYVQDIYLQYKGELFKSSVGVHSIRVWGGKFTPAFGVAHDVTPGVFGTDFAEDYELTERIGFGAAFKLANDRLGEITLRASVFFVDTSILSESIITQRGRARQTDGGPGNTEDLSSFNIALIGEKLFGVEGLKTHVSVVHQNDRVGADETGVSGAIQHAFKIGNVTVTPFLEAVLFWNAEGTSGQRRLYLSTALQFAYGSWSAAISQTLRNTRAPGGGNTKDHLFQVSAGYTFDNGVGVEVGYAYANEDSIGTHTLGLLFTYEFRHGFGRRR